MYSFSSNIISYDTSAEISEEEKFVLINNFNKKILKWDFEKGSLI